MVTLIEVSMTDSPIADLFETMDGKYTPKPVPPTIAAITLTCILVPILAKLYTTTETKPIEQERESNYGIDSKKVHECKGVARSLENSPLVAQHGEETNPSITES
jgi:hypothetical protein